MQFPDVQSQVFLKIGPFPASFFFIFVFSIQLIVHINFADDCIRTADLWCRKRPLYQLHHNHFPQSQVLYHSAIQVPPPAQKR